MEKVALKRPIIQVAIDVLNIDDALRIAEAAVRAGVDWLEAGTPLITFEGVRAIGAIARAFPDSVVLADYKMMDGVGKYVMQTAEQGGHIATICGVASDASIRAAVKAGTQSGVTVICDLYAAPNVAQRAAQVESLGIDSVYVHWGSDQRVEAPDHDALTNLKETVEAVSVPVGVGTFSIADGVRAFKTGATIVVMGMPLIAEPNVEAALREYVERCREAAG